MAGAEKLASLGPFPFTPRALELLCIIISHRSKVRHGRRIYEIPTCKTKAILAPKFKLNRTHPHSRFNATHRAREKRERKFNSSLSARADNRTLKRKYEFASGEISNLNTRRVCAQAVEFAILCMRRRRGKIKALVLIQDTTQCRGCMFV